MSVDALSGDGRLVGGVAVTARKRMSNARPVERLPMPPRLLLPLQEGPADVLAPVVRVGERVYRGQPLATGGGRLGIHVHAPTSGRIARLVAEHVVADPRRTHAPCLELIPDGDDAPWPELAAPDTSTWHSDEALARALAGAGLAGLGGAVFPTGVKIASGRGPGLRSVILNGAECEPFISCDDMLMRNAPREVLGGALALLALTGATQAFVALEDDKSVALAALEEARTAMAAEDQVTLITVPTVYPTGGERQLIQLITGEEVPSGGYPTSIGHLVQNVGTAVAAYRFLTTGEPLTRRITTVTGGGVANPGNMDVPFGAPVEALIEACGGYTEAVHRLIMGGGMTGLAMPHDGFPVTRATNCVVAAARDEVRDNIDPLPCIRCGECSRACPASLMPQLLHWSAARDDEAALDELGLFDCIECGCCDIVCPSHIPLTEQFRQTKRQLLAAADDRARAGLARRRHDARERRLEQRADEQRATLEARRDQVRDPDQAGEAIDRIMQRVRRRRQTTPDTTDTTPDTGGTDDRS